jgi:hypothetical protein
VAFTNQESLDKALKKDREHLGKRYVEVFTSTEEEAEAAVGRLRGEAQHQSSGKVDSALKVVKLRGLPWSTFMFVVRRTPLVLNVTRTSLTSPACRPSTPTVGAPFRSAYLNNRG